MSVIREGETQGVQKSRNLKGIGNLEMIPKRAAQVLHSLQGFLKFPSVRESETWAGAANHAAVARPNSFPEPHRLPRKPVVATGHSPEVPWVERLPEGGGCTVLTPRQLQPRLQATGWHTLTVRHLPGGVLLLHSDFVPESEGTRPFLRKYLQHQECG